MIRINKKIIKKVLERAGGFCEVCGMEGTEFHHIIFGSGCRKVHEEISSITLLCSECHRGTNGVHGKNGRELNLKLKVKLQETYKKQGYSEEKIREMMGGKLYGICYKN